jgi:hypothetical protein
VRTAARKRFEADQTAAKGLLGSEADKITAQATATAGSQKAQLQKEMEDRQKDINLRTEQYSKILNDYDQALNYMSKMPRNQGVAFGDKVMAVKDYIAQIQKQKDSLSKEFNDYRNFATVESQGYKDALNSSGASSYTQKQADQMNRLRALMGSKETPVTASASPNHAKFHDFKGSNVFEIAKTSGFNPANYKILDKNEAWR